MMDTKRAVIFMDDENDGEVKLKKPLLLHSVLFCPMLTWLGNSLRESGVERFFVLCAEKHQEQARACFPAGENVIFSDKLKDLADFLAGSERTLVIPGAAVPVESAGRNEVYAVPGENLARSLRCLGAHLNGPCSRLILSRCQIRNKSQQLIACTNQFVKTGLCKT